MAQNRNPPAYQEYAASTLANRQFRLMTLAERGLFHTLRLECWENKQTPTTSQELAKYLSCDAAEIQSALTDRVKRFFIEENGSFYCPELEDYRQHLEDQRIAKSNGGKQGAAITNAKNNKPRKNAKVRDSGKSSSNSQLTRRGEGESLVQSSTEKQNQTQSLESDVKDDWINEYEVGEHSANNEYARLKG